jgi:light-regulated signal transduction histidine kinase (bacteriophytochrome)
MRWLSARGGAIYNKKGDVVRVLGINTDITEHKQAEEQVILRTEELAKSNADLKQFAYVASHDLREPLRMITSFLQLLERRYKDQLDEEAKEYIGFAVDGALRLDDMIKDLLEYSRITRIERCYSNVNFEEVLDHTLTNLDALIEEKNAMITHDPLPSIFADEHLMLRLFQNLLSNAIKYHGEEPPRVHVSAIKEGEVYVFSVKDNGIGMDSKYLEKIFTIFKRLHKKDEYEGTGIGLSIAQKIVHRHGGEIWAESNLGKGSTFYFTLPSLNISSFA